MASSEENHPPSGSSAKDTNVDVEYFDLLKQNFLACLKKGEYCDVSLQVSEKVFNCHRLLLAANSNYFVSLFKDGFKESKEDTKTLPSEYVDEQSFSKLLNAMYGEPFEIGDDLVPLFTTSVYLQLTHFINRLRRYILTNLEGIDAVELLTLLEVQIDKELYAVIRKHVCRNFSKMYPRMAGISLELFEDLFTDPELFVTNKDQVLDFGKKWISYDIQTRKNLLQKVASFLKPLHSPSELSLELVSNLVKHLHNEFDVKVALNTLFEMSDNAYQVERKLEVSNPLFFVQPNSESEILFGSYKNNVWEFLNNLQLPIACDLLSEYRGAVANNMIYFVGERPTHCDAGFKNESDIIFHGFDGNTREWVELISPRSMPICLIECNSAVYSYEHSCDDHQISVFEPFLNRWLKVPAVNYPRMDAGIASNGHVLYMVGGIPTKKIASKTPTNIVEMYDGRCGNWSRICMSEEKTITNQGYSQCVCFHNDILYMMEKENSKLLAIDVRNYAWLNVEKQLGYGIKVDDGFLTTVDGTLWFIHEDASKGIHLIDVTGTNDRLIPNPNVFVKPIALCNDT